MTAPLRLAPVLTTGRAALAGVETVFHLAAQVAVTTSLADPCQDFSDIAKFTAATGWRPRIGWEQGVRDLHAWLSPGLSSAAVAGVAAQ
jgi:nucleoside-diphosphate-sugar epimerase